MREPDLYRDTRVGKPYVRSGLAALYSFTPFKIIYTKEHGGEVISYTMVFTTPSNYHGYYHGSFTERLNARLNDIVAYFNDNAKERHLNRLWRKRASVARLVDDRTVYIYEEFPSFEFTKTGSPYVMIIDRNLHDYLLGRLSKERLESILKRFTQRRFVLAEFSYKSLSSPRICRKGLVLVSHRDSCPLLELRLSTCRIEGGKCPHYVTSTRETYAGLFKVFPLLKIVVTSQQPEEEMLTLCSLHYKGYPLAIVRFSDNITLIAYYRGIVFRSKTPYTEYDYLYVPMSKKRTIGARIRKTQGLVLTFESTTLKMLFKEVANNEWVRLKCNLLAKAQITLDNLLGGPTVSQSYKIWRELEDLINSISKKKIEDLDKLMSQSPSEELTEFLVVHTLAHVIVDSLRTRLGLSDEEFMYAIEGSTNTSQFFRDADLDELRSRRWRVYFFEAASGGYGFLKALTANRKKLYNLLSTTISAFSEIDLKVKSYCKGLTVLDNQEREEIKKRLLIDISRACQESLEEVISVCKQLEDLVNGLFEVVDRYKVSFHPYALRHVLVNIIPGVLGERFRDFTEKMLTTFGPFDGNVGCCYIEEGCYLGPFLEPFTTSFSILEHVSANQNKLKGKIKDVVLSWLKQASREVRIMTSNMSKETKIFEALKRLRDNRGVTVKVLLGKNAVNDLLTCKAVKELRNTLGEGLKVRIHRRLHDKAIIIESLSVITGTFNLTAQGLNVNIENLEVIVDPSRVKEYIERFDNLWSESEEYNISC